jgi:glycosyltransferase involved in cell wall biosynthesis
VPLVVNTVHGLYAQPTDSWKRRLPVYALERFAAAFSHVELVQNSEDLETLARLRVPRRKLVRLGNGIDLSRFHPPARGERHQIRTELGLADDDIVLGAVGRLVREKGYAELFAAARRLFAERDDVRIVVVGPIETGKSDLLTRAEIDAAERDGVDFLGERDDVERIYRAMDVLIHVSHREGFPRAPMEAAASGVPAVLTDIRGCREVIEEGRGGRFVRPHDPADLFRVLSEVCSLEPANRAALAHTPATVRARFSDEAVIERTLEAYRSRVSQPVVEPA